MYIFDKSLKKYSHKKKIIFSSFESIIIDKIHYIHTIGIYSNKKLKKSDFKIWILFEQIKTKSLLILHSYIQTLLIESEKHKLIYIYSANFQKFDSYFILKTLTVLQHYDKAYIRSKIIIRHGLIYKIQINNIIFLDSFTILNKSFKNVLNQSPRKKKLFQNINHNLYKSIDYLLHFVKKDLITIHKKLKLTRWQLFIRYNINLYKNISISAISLNIFKNNFNDSKQLFDINILSYNLISRSYLGGIANIYLPCIKNSTLYGYDINSLYPFIMFSKPLPAGKPLIQSKNTFKDFQNFFGFIEATILINTYKENPLLSIEHVNNIKQPVGYISGVWFIDEVKMLIERKEVVSFKIHKMITFSKEIFFKRFTKHFYKNRLNISNKKNDDINKFFMNHLSGRLGLKLIKNTTKFVSNDTFSKEIQKSKILMNNLYNSHNLINIIKKHLDMKNKKSNLQSPIHISSVINSYSRCYLLRLIQSQTFQGNKFLFTDTDSFYSNTKILCNNVHLKHLGFFKLEFLSKKTIFLNRNIYYFKNMLLNDSSKRNKKYFNVSNTNKFRFKNFIYNLNKNSIRLNVKQKRIIQNKRQIQKSTKTLHM